MTTMHVELAAIPFSMTGKPETDKETTNLNDEKQLTLADVSRVSNRSVRKLIEVADRIGMRLQSRDSTEPLTNDQCERLLKAIAEFEGTARLGTAGVGVGRGEHGV